MSIIDDKDYKDCCKIINKLSEYDNVFMEDLLICLCANYKDVREYILNYYSEELEQRE